MIKGEGKKYLRKITWQAREGCACGFRPQMQNDYRKNACQRESVRMRYRRQIHGKGNERGECRERCPEEGKERAIRGESRKEKKMKCEFWMGGDAYAWI
jgi:hypothetical protein